jgi:hypothetical protein
MAPEPILKEFLGKLATHGEVGLHQRVFRGADPCSTIMSEDEQKFCQPIASFIINTMDGTTSSRLSSLEDMISQPLKSDLKRTKI